MSKIVLFISAFVPMYILFLINLIVELINANLTLNVTNTCVMVGLIVLTLIGTIGLMCIIKFGCKEYKSIKILTKKNITDQHFLNYFSLFVLFAFIGVVYIKNNIFYVNPLLNILGYSFYDITYLDKNEKEQQVRIFFKGTLDVANNPYQLCISNRNLNFLKKEDKKF